MAESELLSLSPFPSEVNDTIGPDVGTSVFRRSTATIPLKTIYKPLYSFNTTIVDIFFPFFVSMCIVNRFSTVLKHFLSTIARSKGNNSNAMKEFWNRIVAKDLSIIDSSLFTNTC